jgi:hypothetical protein
MSRNVIQFAVASVLALSASAAFAAPITFPAADPDPKIVNMSGATATDIVLADALINDTTSSVCDATLGDIEVFTTETSFLPTVANYAIACHTRATLPTGAPAAAANIEVIFRKYSGGSGSGISQVASGATLNNDAINNRNWVDVLTCRAAGPGVAVPAAGGRSAYQLYTSCAVTGTGRVTHAGISDVEPALLAATATQLSQLDVSGGVAIDFAPIVSTALYGALQNAQGLTAAGCTVNDQTAACVPNISSSQLVGIFTGRITAGTALYNNPAGDTGVGTNLGSGQVFVCRRGASSGTQTSYQVHYLRQGCGTAGSGVPSLVFAAATTTGCTAAGCGWSAATYGADRVFAGTGSSDVVACVDQRSDNAQFAVGVLSTEVLGNDAANAAFRHVRVDGVLPSLENIQGAAYDFFTENTMNTPNANSPQFATRSSQQINVPTAILATMRTQGALRASLVNHPWGWGGVLGVPTGAGSSPVPQGINSQHTLVQTTPINSQTRAASYGGAPNNCNPAWTGARTILPKDTPAN